MSGAHTPTCSTCGDTTGFVNRRGTLDVCDDPWHDEHEHDLERLVKVYCEKCGSSVDRDPLFEDEPFVCPICVETCEHNKDAATCGECHSAFGVGA